MLVPLLLSTAFAATPQEARATFDRFVAQSAAFDPAALELVADDATIRHQRDGQAGEMSGARFKEVVASSLEAAKAAGDVSTYKKVKVKPSGDGFRVTAHRTSAMKCSTDRDFELRLEERGGELRIVDMFTTTTGLSQCPPEPALGKLLEATRAGLVGKLPLQLDEDTRLDAVEVQGSALVYDMTLVTVNAAEFDLAKLRDTLSPIVVGQVCTAGGQLQPLSAQGATIRYAYRTNDGTVIPPLDISPAICAQVGQ